MLFNSYAFIFCFLPVTFFVYFWLNHMRLVTAGKSFLVLASLFFYGWWKLSYLPLILVSMLVNFTVGKSMRQENTRLSARQILGAGIFFNLAMLGFFKYTDFFIGNINQWFGADLPQLHIILPLAISFFTFQQIAYLIDSYQKQTNEYDFLNYALFVSFFPQLIAGPIVHHGEMMPQFASKWNAVKRYKNIALGLFIFSIGLFKKTVIADTFSQWATPGFDIAPSLNFFEAWAASLSYTFQLYFDFSAYCDLAIGVALLFNIRLPINFNSPYKALNIQDFWRRWHITLSRFLRDYLYIPLGGNRRSEIRVYANIFLVFLLGGLWHGASWMFVIWGAMHGCAMIIHQLWQKTRLKIPVVISWILTFGFINVTWVFFRAQDMEAALKVLRGMAGMQGFMLPERFASILAPLSAYGFTFGAWLERVNGDLFTPFWIISALVLCLACQNSMQIKLDGKWYKALWAGFLLAMGLFMLARPSEFLYFNF